MLKVNKQEAKYETFQCRGTYVRPAWLQNIYRSKCDARPWTLAAQAYLLHLVDCTLFAKKSATHISVVFLDAFHDLSQYGSYLVGAAPLVHMYDNLNDASKHTTKRLTRYITLLQAIKFFYLQLLILYFIFTIDLKFYLFFINMCCVGSIIISLQLLPLSVMRITMRGNHMLIAESLGRHYQC